LLRFFGAHQWVSPLLPKEFFFFHGKLLKVGAIEKQSLHVHTDTASARMTMECCAMHVQTDDNTVPIDYNPSAALVFVTCLILKLPSLIGLPFYLIF
jgi:hypothetical protein